MVSVLQAQPLLLLSTETVVLSAFSIQLSFSGATETSASSLEQQCPLLHKKRTFLHFPFCSTDCFIRYEKLTHNPFIQTQIELEHNQKNDVKVKLLHKHLIVYFIIILLWFNRLVLDKQKHICCVTLKSNRVCPYVKACFTLVYFMMACFQAGSVVWYPSVTPQLSPACRGQNTQPAAECLFTGEAGQ